MSSSVSTYLSKQIHEVFNSESSFHIEYPTAFPNIDEN